MNLSALIWNTADLLRGDYKQSEYGKIILPFTLLRRVECVIEPTRDDVLEEYEKRKNLNIPLDAILTRKTGHSFYNTSTYTLNKLMSDPNNIGDNLKTYISNFSANTRDIFDKYEFENQIDKLNDNDLLFQIVKQFSNFNLSPESVSNHDMGILFEELIRKFAEQSNETAGEHFTPRDMVRLTTSLLFSEDKEILIKDGIVRSLYDPTAGTGGFLSSASEYVRELNESANLVTYGQELNSESYAICKADMMIKGEKVENIKLGNTLSNDQLAENKFDYMLSNPPFGVEWKKVQKQVTDEHKIQGYNGRFGAGLPRVSDGSLLFLLHLISKMKPINEGGSRIGIILNGSPLFTGGAGSGESEIRRYILESDLLEAIVGMPTDMFFNTGISTYIWILSNNKEEYRKNKVQLIDASKLGEPMRKSLGSKRKYLTDEQIENIVGMYANVEESKTSKLFNTTDFGFRKVTIERPLQLAYYPKDAAKLETLQADKAWQKLKESLANEILEALETMSSKITSKVIFDKEIAKKVPTKLTKTYLNLLQKHLSQHDENAEIAKDTKGEPIANADLRDYENIPLSQDIYEYFEKEVKPHVPLAWIDEKKTDKKDGKIGIVGYEIPFNRHFYEYIPPRPLETIDAELEVLTKDILELLNEV